MEPSAETLAQIRASGALCPTCNKISKERAAEIERAAGAKMMKNLRVLCSCP